MIDKDKTRLLYFAIGIVAMSFIYLFCVTFLPVPESGKQNANLIVGFLLGTGVGSVLNFYFGSSKGSQDKNDLIKRGQ